MQVDFFLNTKDGMIRCSNHDIYYIQAHGKHSRVVTNRGDFFVSTAIGKLETECLPDDVFCRVDRSFIVSLHNVPSFTLDGIVINGDRIPIAKAYRVKLFSSLKIIW
jgi:DNA-binding LytR/AlgR family response regulator